MGKNRSYDQSQLQQLPTTNQLVAPLHITFRDAPALSLYPIHGHAWGEFIYAFNGVMEINIEQHNYLTPPPYGIWLPPHLKHSGFNRTCVSSVTFYVHESLCTRLPQHAGILLTSPLVNAILIHLKRDLESTNEPEYLRLLQVLLDQLHTAPLVRSYLPHSNHERLKKILDYLHQYPADQSSLAQLAFLNNMTERTLARYCQKELGMSLHEWRQRLKVIKAISMLNEGRKIESIALDLGYANASAFINMFKRWMHMTPDQFRKH